MTKSIVKLAFRSLPVFLVPLRFPLLRLIKFSHFGSEDGRWLNDNRSSSMTEQMFMMIGGVSELKVSYSAVRLRA